MHKLSPQNAGNDTKETLFFKISGGSMPHCPWSPPEVLAPSALVGQTDVRPPKIGKPVRLWM